MKVPLAVKVFRNGFITTLNKAVTPSLVNKRISPGYMTKLSKLSTVSVPFGSMVISPVPEFFSQQNQLEVSEAAAVKVTVNVPLVISCSVPRSVPDKLKVDVLAVRVSVSIGRQYVGAAPGVCVVTFARFCNNKYMEPLCSTDVGTDTAPVSVLHDPAKLTAAVAVFIWLARLFSSDPKAGSAATCAAAARLNSCGVIVVGSGAVGSAVIVAVIAGILSQSFRGK